MENANNEPLRPADEEGASVSDVSMLLTSKPSQNIPTQPWPRCAKLTGIVAVFLLIAALLRGPHHGEAAALESIISETSTQRCKDLAVPTSSVNSVWQGCDVPENANCASCNLWNNNKKQCEWKKGKKIPPFITVAGNLLLPCEILPGIEQITELNKNGKEYNDLFVHAFEKLKEQGSLPDKALLINGITGRTMHQMHIHFKPLANMLAKRFRKDVMTATLGNTSWVNVSTLVAKFSHFRSDNSRCTAGMAKSFDASNPNNMPMLFKEVYDMAVKNNVFAPYMDNIKKAYKFTGGHGACGGTNGKETDTAQGPYAKVESLVACKQKCEGNRKCTAFQYKETETEERWCSMFGQPQPQRPIAHYWNYRCYFKEVKSLGYVGISVFFPEKTGKKWIVLATTAGEKKCTLERKLFHA